MNVGRDGAGERGLDAPATPSVNGFTDTQQVPVRSRS
jgi:hypothetical protein